MILEILVLLVCLVGVATTLHIIRRWDSILNLTNSLRKKIKPIKCREYKKIKEMK